MGSKVLIIQDVLKIQQGVILPSYETVFFKQQIVDHHIKEPILLITNVKKPFKACFTYRLLSYREGLEIMAYFPELVKMSDIDLHDQLPYWLIVYDEYIQHLS